MTGQSENRDAAAIDWDRVREQVAAMAGATDGSGALSPEQAKAVMDERARRLAEVPAAPPADVVEVVTFSLAGARYGIELRYVHEIVRLAEITPVPGAPDFFVGLMALRGEILDVVDLRKLLGVDAKETSDLARVILLGEEVADLGVLADAVDAVIAITEDEILAPPAGARRAYVRGVTRGLPEDTLVVLSGAALLGDTGLEHEGDGEPAAPPG